MKADSSWFSFFMSYVVELFLVSLCSPTLYLISANGGDIWMLYSLSGLCGSLGEPSSPLLQAAATKSVVWNYS